MHKQVDIELRRWRNADLPASAEIARKAWPESTGPVPAGFVEAYLRLYRHRSTWTQTAATPKGPVGLLFGRIERDIEFYDRLKGFFSFAVIASKAFSAPGNLKNIPIFLRTLIATESKIRRLRPATGAEIALLFVDPEYQSRGIGKTLVENFISESESKNAGRITVCTGEDSNWRFYEHLGFERLDEFYDDLDSFLMDRPVKGFIYLLELRRR